MTKRAELIAFGVYMGRNVSGWGCDVLADTCESLTKASAAAHNLGVRMCNEPAPASDPEWERAMARVRRRVENIVKELERYPKITGKRRVTYELQWDPRGACLRIGFGKSDAGHLGYPVPCLSDR